MCGIAGMIDFRCETSEQELYEIAGRMASAIRHRGPDDGGVWVDAVAGIAFAHRRLSIVDLSPAGHQPMVSPHGRYIIVFNGEIYNHRELREELTQENGGRLPLRGHSDTEVLLVAIEHWGLEATLLRANGMFAFGLWDRQGCTLYLVRDRLGEKPLYYGWLGRTLIFGSELKALRAHPDFEGEINRDALALYLRHSYIPAPYSIYSGVQKLPPAVVLSVSHKQERAERQRQYWSLKEVAERASKEPFRGSDAEAVECLDRLLRDSVRMRMLADVPLGSFLSGGVDSSTVTALMQVQSAQPIRTFTIGNGDSSYDEAVQAKSVAKHLGTEHTELYANAEQALGMIPRIATTYDEPFADSSQIPTLLLSELTRQHVTVGLSGDGGDELFGGYNRHVWNKRIWKAVGWLPLILRRSSAAAIATVPSKYWDFAWPKIGPLLPSHWEQRQPGYKLHKLAEVLRSADLSSFYYGTTSHWLDPASVILSANEPETILTDRNGWPNLPEFEDQMMYLDSVSYLPDDILAKVDRASMAVSLETRVPLLDHRVVEFAWTLPLRCKIRAGQGKWSLRQVLYRYVPRELVERPKSGFAIPLGAWLRGELRDWADSLLDASRLRQEGYFRPEPVQQKWAEHLSGQREWETQLWSVLMFETWIEDTAKSASTPSSQLVTNCTFNA